MTIKYKNMCPCDEYDFSLSYTSPTEEAVQLFCPFCGVEIEDSLPEDEDEDADQDQDFDD